MATKITSGSIFNAGAVIVGVDADAPPATPSAPVPPMTVGWSYAGLSESERVAPASNGMQLYRHDQPYTNAHSNRTLHNLPEYLEGLPFAVESASSFAENGIQGTTNAFEEYTFNTSGTLYLILRADWGGYNPSTLELQLSDIDSRGVLDPSTWTCVEDSVGYMGGAGDYGTYVFSKSVESGTHSLNNLYYYAFKADPAPESAPEPASSDQYYIVGATGDDTSGSNSGGAFVYDANDLSAAPVQLSWPGASTNDKFGNAAVFSSDKFVVGAYGDNGFKGSLFVYDKNDLSAAPVQLTAPDGVDWDLLGDYDLAMSDTHILAGAFGDDDVATSAGSAYLWDLSDLSASPTKLQPSNLIERSNFGFNVALSDSYAIISAKGGNADTGNSATTSGAPQDPGGIYIYDLSDLSAAPIELMAPEDGDVVGSSFGAGQGGSIGILGNTLVVGASTLLIDGDSRAGKVYIYDMSDLSAAPIELTEPSSGYSYNFGQTVGITETHIVVGAPRSRSGSPSSKDSGAVYIYDRSDLSAAPVQLLGNDLVSTNQPKFGRSVDLTDTTVIVGAPNEAIDGNNSVGAVYIWSLSDLTANPTRLTSPNAAAGDDFGISVAIG